MDKVVASPREAVADIPDGATLSVGGFGLCGVPIKLIDALLEQGASDLVTISNNCGVDDQALGVLLYAGRIRRTISSFVGGNQELARLYLSGQLVDGILPIVPGLPQRLAEGIRVADIGCGTGHAINLMARAFPASVFTGYDVSAEAIEKARAEAERWGLGNAGFEVCDVRTLPIEPFDVVFAFDSVHDQVDPSGVLARVHEALRPGGLFVMFDIRAASALEVNVGNPFAPWLYGISTLHCMTVSLAEGGAGLGTVWGEQLALRMLAEAGFAGTTVHEVPDDPTDALYVARKAG
jgi:SAM-dependent methyltransferase